MGYLDASEHQEAFQRFLDGKEFYSPAPQPIDEISPVTLKGLQDRIGTSPYKNRTLRVTQVDGSVRFIHDFAGDDDSLSTATQVFCTAANTTADSVEVRYGRFTVKRTLAIRSRLVRTLHIDALRDNTLTPLYTSTMVVGIGGVAFVGTARRSRAHPQAIEPVRGRYMRMREGMVYLLGPLCGHYEPPPGLLATNRYFWRHFHDDQAAMAA